MRAARACNGECSGQWLTCPSRAQHPEDTVSHLQVKLPDGQQTLCVLPSKFNKKLWVKRGGFLIIEHGEVINADTQQKAWCRMCRWCSTRPKAARITARTAQSRVQDLSAQMGRREISSHTRYLHCRWTRSRV